MPVASGGCDGAERGRRFLQLEVAAVGLAADWQFCRAVVVENGNELSRVECV
jgi:hypothetical protein